LGVANLLALMERTSGVPEFLIGLIDGPVAAEHPDLATQNIRHLRPPPPPPVTPTANGASNAHGTYVAGILCARRNSGAPAICPRCSLLVRPIFFQAAHTQGGTPSATPDELADAILDCLNAGARVLNLSVAIAQPSPNPERRLEEALHLAARRGALVVAAAGNQGVVASSAITRHPWVIPVAACDLRGRPMPSSNLADSIGKRGVLAPGEGVSSLAPAGAPPITSGGTSAAAPFVTGTIALLWSQFPAATALQVRQAVIHATASSRSSVVPPLLNAWESYRQLAAQSPPGARYPSTVSS
jgi:subtilisin family serine protease